MCLNSVNFGLKRATITAGLAITLMVTITAISPTVVQAEEASIWPPSDTPPVPLPSGPVDAETGRLVSQMLALPRLAEGKNRESLKAELKHRLTTDPTQNEKPKSRPELWRSHLKAFELLKVVARRDGLEIKWPKEPKEEGPNLAPLMDIARQAVLRAYWRVDRGETQQAVDDLVDVLSFGMLLESARGGLINSMVGLAISGIGLRHTAHLVPRLNASELTRIRDLLVAQAARPGYVGPVFAYEQHAQEFMWEEMRHWTVEKLFAKVKPKAPNLKALSTASIRAVYDADKSIAFSRDFWRRFIEAAKKPPAQRKLPGLPNLRKGVEHLTDNPVGRILLSIAIPDFGRYLDREDRLRCYRRMVLVRVAVALYQKRHKKPPPTLDALVPEQLADLPIDLFAFKRAPQEPEASFLYEAGTRRISSGAQEKTGPIPIEIRWSP